MSAGRAVLDAARAAGQLDGGPQLSPRVALELEVVGAAPAEPATDLATLLGRASGQAGKVLTVEAVDAWSRVYPELSFEEALADRAEPLARLVARRCLVDWTAARFAGDPVPAGCRGA